MKSNRSAVLGISLLLGMFLSLSLLLSLPINAQPPLEKRSTHLQAELATGNTVEFLVILTEQADLSAAQSLPNRAARGAFVTTQLQQTAQQSQADLRHLLRQQGVRFQPFYIINALLVQGDAGLAAALAARPDVARLVSNPQIYNLPAESLFKADLPARTPATIEPGVQYIHADDVWALGFTGQGIVVGGQDTGYDWDHPALINQYRGWDGNTANHDYHWHDAIHATGSVCGADSPVPCDDNSHGTHTMGTAVGSDGGSNQIGVAPGAQWIGCRNMNSGWGTPATYLECMEFFLAPYPVGGDFTQGRPELAPDVTVNSWTCPPSEGCDTHSLQAGLAAQRAAGIMTVAAAGNSGPTCSSISDPIAIYDDAYTVGALNTDSDTLASFSGRGPVIRDGSNRTKPDIVAPGTGTRSAIPGTGYGSKQGTSMATPHVAGAVALLWSAVPTLTNNISATEVYLNQSAVPISTTICSSPAQVPNNLFGAGRLDILAAVQQAQHNTTTLPAAIFALSNPPYIAGEVITFTNLSTGTAPLTSTWHFGDGASAIQNHGSLQLPLTHTYAGEGVFSVTLTVTNPHGSNVVSRTLTIFPADTIIPPTAAFTVSNPVFVNQPAIFSNLSNGTAPLTATWHFGDGETTTTALAGTLWPPTVHTYTQSATYTVALTVSNTAGSDTVSQSVRVWPRYTLYLPLIHKD